ncbi:MAG: helix-turn-helix domain-containing protein [Alphaproteobacteria bacterium]
MSITPAQIKAALALAGMKQDDLVHQSGVSQGTITGLLNGQDVKTSTIKKIQIAIESQGVEFTDNEGIRKKSKAQVLEFEGKDGFRQFMDRVYKAAFDGYCEFRIRNARPENWERLLGKEWYASHATRMKAIADSRPEDSQISFKITSCEGDPYQIASGFAEYRWIKKEIFNEQSIYMYGDNVAFLIFEENNIRIINIQSQDILNTELHSFDFMWEHQTLKPAGKAITDYE